MNLDLPCVFHLLDAIEVLRCVLWNGAEQKSSQLVDQGGFEPLQYLHCEKEQVQLTQASDPLSSTSLLRGGSLPWLPPHLDEGTVVLRFGRFCAVCYCPCFLIILQFASYWSWFQLFGKDAHFDGWSRDFTLRRRGSPIENVVEYD